MTIADRITYLRKARELSQEELAEKAGVSRQAVSKWESEQSVPDMYNVVALSEIFGVTTDYLLKGMEPLSERPERKNKPAMAYNIIATALNAIGFVMAIGIADINREPLVGTLTGFVFMVLGIMTFMLGTTRISRHEQLSNACKFFRINVWILAFFAFSVIYNAATGAGVAPFPTYDVVSYYKGGIYVNGAKSTNQHAHFIEDVAPAIFVIVYTLFCAAATYVLTWMERKSRTGDFPKKRAKAEKQEKEVE